MDFMSDQLAGGERIRLLTVIDICTRECLTIEVARSFSGHQVTEALDRLLKERGKPKCITTDNGPEFAGLMMDQWSSRQEVRHHFIAPGKPTQNCFIESFNARVRDDCLNANWFISLEDSRRIVKEWTERYNNERGHSSLGRKTPTEYAREFRNHRPSSPEDGRWSRKSLKLKRTTNTGMTYFRSGQEKG